MKIYTKDLKPGDRFITVGNAVYTCIGVQSDNGRSRVQYKTAGMSSAYWTAALAMVEVVR